VLFRSGSIGNSDAAKALLDALPGVSSANQLAFCEGLLRCAEAVVVAGNRKEALGIYDRLRELSGPHQVRTAALRGAILTRQQDGLPLLRLALHSDDFVLVSAAARTAQEMPGAPVTQLLAGELASLPADRQILVIQTLAKRGDDAALPALFAAAQKGEQPVRLAAIRALAEIDNPSALPVLLDLMGDADQKIAQAAQESLAALPSKEVDAAIMTMLSSGAPARRITAMDLIVRRRMISAIPALTGAAGDSDSKVRLAALKKLGELAGPAELPALLSLLGKATGPDDLEATEQTLSSIISKAVKPDSCVQQLEARLADSPPAQKCALLRVLGAVGGTNALPAVRAAVNDPNTEVRAAAIRVLSGWSTTDAAPDLLALAKTAGNPAEKMICLRGYIAFAGHADMPKPQRLAMCQEAAPLAENDNEKKLLLAALGGIVSPQALELIEPYLDNPATKEEASTGILSIAGKLLQDAGNDKAAPKLIGPLDKVAQVTANADLAKQAKELSAESKSRAVSK
jgi:HEAT repeat protein